MTPVAGLVASSLRGPGRHVATIPATPAGMNRIESTRSAPNTGCDQVAGIVQATGPELQEESPTTAPQTEVTPPNTEPTSKRIESQ